MGWAEGNAHQPPTTLCPVGPTSNSLRIVGRPGAAGSEALVRNKAKIRRFLLIRATPRIEAPHDAAELSLTTGRTGYRNNRHLLRPKQHLKRQLSSWEDRIRLICVFVPVVPIFYGFIWPLTDGFRTSAGAVGVTARGDPGRAEAVGGAKPAWPASASSRGSRAGAGARAGC
jgi:hypothetical protein